MRYHDRHFAQPHADRLSAGRTAALPGDLERVVRSAVEGDPLAWTELFRRFTRRISAIARAHRLGAHEADDVVQNTWLRVLEHIDDLGDPERLAAWLNTTARRESYRYLRRNSREIPSADELDRQTDEPSVFDAIVAAERSAALRKALESATDPQRALMTVLVADPEPSYAEAAAALGIPIGSVGPTRGRCIARLRADREFAEAARD